MNEQQLKELENRINKLTLKLLVVSGVLNDIKARYGEADLIYYESLRRFNYLENKLKEVLTEYNKIKSGKND